MKIRILLSALAAVCSATAFCQAPSVTGYTVQVIDAPTGMDTYPYNIAENGTIVGNAYGSGPYGFRYDGTFSTVTIPQAVNRYIDGNNSAGNMVGHTVDDLLHYHPFQIIDGVLSEPGNINQSADTAYYDINDADQIAGSYGSANSHSGFILDHGALSTYNVPGAGSTDILGIDNLGDIAGGYRNATGRHGFVRRGATFSSLDVAGANNTFAWDMNIHGRAVGGARTPSGIGRGFIWEDGVFTMLDFSGGSRTYTNAFGINDRNQVVGAYFDPQLGRPRGFLLTPVGETPVPEPRTMALLLAALPATVLCRRRHPGPR